MNSLVSRYKQREAKFIRVVEILTFFFAIVKPQNLELSLPTLIVSTIKKNIQRVRIYIFKEPFF